MVYEEPPERLAEMCVAKVESQFSRALHYVAAIDARHVVPSAGPPCFLDAELFGLNMITGREASIFPDQTEFIRRLAAAGRSGVLNIPGTTLDIADGGLSVTHPLPQADVDRIFTDKLAGLRRYQADWSEWLERHRAGWSAPAPDLVGRLAAWWEPLLAMAPTLRQAVGSAALVRAGDVEILVDFPAGEVRPYAGEAYRYRFDIPRELVETVAAAHAVDWSNALFLSCRFRAWREGPFNEYLYNFFKSLSVERMRRTEAEAKRKLDPATDSDEEIEIGGYLVERYCPHRQADLTVFGECEGDTLTCTLHGWRFDLRTGRCLSSTDRSLRVRPGATALTSP